MIKCETIHGLQVVKINPVLVSANDVENYSFVTDNGNLYLISNTITGDTAYIDSNVIKAGDYLNGYDVASLVGLKLVVDGKHINGEYADLEEDGILTAGEDGKLKVAASAPDSGVYFKITAKTALTEPAVKVLVCVA